MAHELTPPIFFSLSCSVNALVDPAACGSCMTLVFSTDGRDRYSLLQIPARSRLPDLFSLTHDDPQPDS